MTIEMYIAIASVGAAAIFITGYQIGIVKGERKERDNRLHEKAMNTVLPDELAMYPATPNECYPSKRRQPSVSVFHYFTNSCSRKRRNEVLAKKLLTSLLSASIATIEKDESNTIQKGDETAYKYTLKVKMK